ncbi:MAG: HAMP domain-containing protein [Shewanella fodinae]|nr:HAMP domain-containing protein [Shewanella fodinae]
MVFRIQFRDLEKVATALQDIAEGEGDLTVRITTKNQHDEIGQLAQGFNRFVALLAQMVGRLETIATHLTSEASDTRKVADNTAPPSQHSLMMSLWWLPR